MVTYDWNEEMCRSYAEGLRPITRFDHCRWATRIAGQLQDLPPGATLVDLATGPGFLLIEIGKRKAGLHLVAQDLAEPMLTIAREDAAAADLSISTVCCPAEELTLGDSEADVVTCKQLLHEAQDPRRVFAEALRILKPGGRLFLIDFDADGSLLAALAVRTMLRISRGKQISHSFWKSFKSGLRGADVRSLLVKTGFECADYQRSGFNYFITATKGR